MADYGGRAARGGGGGRGRRRIVAGRPLFQNESDDDWDDEGGRPPQFGRNRNQGNRRQANNNMNDDRNRQRQPNDGDRLGDKERRGPRGGKPLVLGEKFLKDLETREPSDILLTIANPHSDFRGALKTSIHKRDILVLLLSVLARGLSCSSLRQDLNIVLTIMKEQNFFDTSADFFLGMLGEDSPYRQKTFRKPIKDMITIMSEIIAKNPTSVIQTIGVYQILQMVIDGLREKSTVIDNDITTAFRQLTDHKERLLTRNKRKELSQEEKDQEQDIEGPPDDFRDIEIFPQTADMQVQDDRFLRANKVKGKYENLDHYLDVQFRLLREDFVGPLREGVSDYVQAIREIGKNKKPKDVRIYYGVSLVTPICGDNGMYHLLQFDVTRMRNVRWRSTKRLIYGSLLCLSADNFKTFYFATVMDRKPESLQIGHVTVRFEHKLTDVNELFGTIFTMAETTAYFESYRHVLSGLKTFHQGDLPFDKYIVSCETNVWAPAYLRRNANPVFDLRPLVDEDVVLHGDSRLEHFGIEREDHERNPRIAFSKQAEPAKAVEVLNREAWPPADLLHLDDSQFKAIHTALTKEFVITQGPPGTGKTYIGLKIVKALLHNKETWSTHPDTGQQDLRPMLIVCYTNHALDQFLEGIVKFFKGDVLRVGSRSSSEVLKEINLHNFRQRFRHAQKIPVAVYQGRRNAKNEMDSYASEMGKISQTIMCTSTAILHEDYLEPYMKKHYHLLVYQFQAMLSDYPESTEITRRKGFSVIVEWLGLGCLAPIVELEGNFIPANEPEEVVDDLIDVEEEVDFIQEQRQVDDDTDEIDLDDDEMQYLTRKQMKDLLATHARTVGRRAVALDVGSMEEKPKEMEIGEWRTQKKQRKKMKRNVQRNLCSGEVMGEEEADRITDMIRMSISDKWRLYRLWKKMYCDHFMQKIDEKQMEYEAAAERYKEALMQEDKEIMKCSTVIGMTTTGAARYQAILQEIRPRIIVLEEAAEVLEAHVITTLSRGCEHLILIGDHKQLKPNPTVYKLATKYNLDVSLFERMVKNRLRCDCLELQHRMRPEIAELMHPIYENYRNHKDVTNYENIKGISENLFFINHNLHETHDDDLRSHSNEFEAAYIVALCKYLLLQGYDPKQITVLTMYSGQLFALRNIMPKSQFEGVRVTVVDNYQGEENDIILLSLVRSNEDGNIGFLKIDNRVCVALSRAKKGFYVIGNFDLLSECGKSGLWRELVIDMKRRNLLGDGLLLHCQNHPEDDGIVARTPTDFERAPEGGCDKKCAFRLQCGHACDKFCHVIDQEHDDYMCIKKCNKAICRNGHRCMKRCYESCGKCEVLVDKKISRCGHTQKVPCHMNPGEFTCLDECTEKLACGHPCLAPCGKAHTSECMFTVKNSWPCGHTGDVFCYQKNDAPCPNACEGILECEHRCTGTCGLCIQGRLHRPCVQDCNRILVCGHECTGMCKRCPPCTKPCENRCVHSKCNQPCGNLCRPCMEPCQWQCEHFKCTKLCSEPCDRPRCNKPCKRVLDCRHPCIGLCGEPCPTDCRVCDNQKVTEIFFGNEDEPDAHFVLLEDCKRKCIIESKSLDHLMDSTQEDGQEIMLKTCPKCRTTIRKSRRYGTIINKTLQDIEDVKKKMLFSKTMVLQLEEEIKASLDENIDNDARIIVSRRLKAMPEPKTEHALLALKNQVIMLRRMTIIKAEWKKLHGVAYSTEKAKMLKFISNFEEWVIIKRSVMTSQEIDDAECELLRTEHKLKLLLHEKRLKERGKDIDTRLRTQMGRMEKILDSAKKYKGLERNAVEGCLEVLKKIAPLTGLGIDDEERKMIVSAMALPSGHWFKCPQGHVYAIGDCGGATVEGRCPECNATIGGTGHQLRTDNQFAREMDDASHPAWSEQANLINYGFEARY